MRLLEFDADSVPARLGFQSGDVVTHVNRIPVAQPQSSLQLLMQLRAARSFRVETRRRGTARTLVVEVE